MTERETLLAEIAEKQARIAEIDAEPDYEAWRPALEAYYTSLWGQPPTLLNFPSDWAKGVIRGLTAALPKAPPMGERQPRWPSEGEVTQADRDAAEALRGSPAYALGFFDHTPLVQAFARHRIEATAEALSAMQEAREALVTAEKVFASYANLHRAKNTKEGDQKAATNTGYSLDMGEAAEALTAALRRNLELVERPTLTREMVEEAHRQVYGNCCGQDPSIYRLYAALVERLSLAQNDHLG